MHLPIATGLGRRGAAGVLLGCGSAAGWWIGGRSTGRVAVVALGAALPGTMALSWTARRAISAGTASAPTVPPAFGNPAAAGSTCAATGGGLPITVLIPARDEVAHIPDLLHDLGCQDLGRMASLSDSGSWSSTTGRSTAPGPPPRPRSVMPVSMAS